MKKNELTGYVMALTAIFIWGTTFISTKIILKDLTPVEILFYRFLIAYFALMIIYPKFHKIKSLKEELLFLSLGLSGVTLYFLVENTALQYTLASNVGLLLSTAPIFTALLAHFFTHDEKFNKNFLVGFIVAMVGIFLVLFNGKYILKLNPIGDLLALSAAIFWALYSILLKKICKEYSHIYVVRKTFFYGLITVVPLALILGADFKSINGISLNLGLNILFLGLGASALCFVFWNNAVSILGAVKSSNFIYLIPFITMITSSIILHETVNLIMIVGCIFILVGVYISDDRVGKPKLKRVNSIE
ncbi:DMT family transporter [Clostridium grantii]|uniref:Permease of the drug/metabolite transporter (DMT) superfamily n=1 Tax=Clostridium grantii DSM 8605 TaxID=1121316 RepID=A0A1M5V775_9CLOT|nr:Permease of the drug/metabolite transporter (DMT) superfamily [Clostridium grantii DSM 8605]